MRKDKNNGILIEYITEQNAITKYMLTTTLLLGALGFLIVGTSSFLRYNIIPFLNAEEIIFFPQGITMCFYGFCGLIVGINQIRILVSKIGEGYNEFNKENGTVKIYRKRGFNKSDINIIYPLADILR